MVEDGQGVEGVGGCSTELAVDVAGVKLGADVRDVAWSRATIGPGSCVFDSRPVLDLLSSQLKAPLSVRDV